MKPLEFISSKNIHLDEILLKKASLDFIWEEVFIFFANGTTLLLKVIAFCDCEFPESLTSLIHEGRIFRLVLNQIKPKSQN